MRDRHWGKGGVSTVYFERSHFAPGGSCGMSFSVSEFFLTLLAMGLVVLLLWRDNKKVRTLGASLIFTVPITSVLHIFSEQLDKIQEFREAFKYYLAIYVALRDFVFDGIIAFISRWIVDPGFSDDQKNVLTAILVSSGLFAAWRAEARKNHLSTPVGSRHTARFQIWTRLGHSGILSVGVSVVPIWACHSCRHKLDATGIGRSCIPHIRRRPTRIDATVHRSPCAVISSGKLDWAVFVDFHPAISPRAANKERF